jgi:hypothetical protein
MRRSLVLLLVAAAACSGDRETVFDPTIGASADLLPNTATVVIGGVEYEYGCPDFPCPVTAIVTQHINSGQWFWLPDGTFTHRAIYLTILRVPVQMKVVPDEEEINPPPTPTPKQPYLDGPTEVLGRILPTINQLTCGEFDLDLISPDGGSWDFVSGTITYQYVTFNPTTQEWEPTGQSSNVPFGAEAWANLLAGTYRLYPPFPNLEYYALFTAKLKRGTTTVQVTHELLCHKDVPPAPPPAPSLDGPTQILGKRPPPVKNLICTGVELELISPDQGPWDFVSGSQVLEFYAWDPVKRMFVSTGNSTTTPLDSDDWDDLLDGEYTTDPIIFTGPYFATFNITLERGPFQHTVSHRLACGGEDFLDMLGIAAGD